jgi:large subunit ribosomal protein L35
MPSIKMKTHKGLKKRFKVSANGKVLHKPCGSSHLNSHKSGKKIRRLRRAKVLKPTGDAHRIRRALRERESVVPRAHAAAAPPAPTEAETAVATTAMPEAPMGPPSRAACRRRSEPSRPDE